MPKVIKAFSGVKDGEVYPTDFVPGDTVEGELAEIAKAEGWCDGGKPKKDQQPAADAATAEQVAAAQAVIDSEDASAEDKEAAQAVIDADTAAKEAGPAATAAAKGKRGK